MLILNLIKEGVLYTKVKKAATKNMTAFSVIEKNRILFFNFHFLVALIVAVYISLCLLNVLHIDYL